MLAWSCSAQRSHGREDVAVEGGHTDRDRGGAGGRGGSGGLQVPGERGASGRPRQPGDGDVGEQVVVADPVEQLQAPGQLAERRVDQGVRERLRLRRLEPEVGAALVDELQRPVEPTAILVVEGRELGGISRGHGEDLRDVDPGDVLGVDSSELEGDRRADVVAVHAVAVVAVDVHQLGERRGDAGPVPAGPARHAREPEPRDRWDDQIERRFALGQRRDHAQPLRHGHRPAVDEQQRTGAADGRAHVQVVQVDPVDPGEVLRVAVELRLPAPPVVAAPPVLGELPHAPDRDPDVATLEGRERTVPDRAGRRGRRARAG